MLLFSAFHWICLNLQVDDDVDKSDDEFDECITLGKSSPFQAVKWQFPDTDKCPLVGCGLSFSSRLFAIMHFRLNHSSSAMLCMVCAVPFASTDTSNLVQHYESHHPDANLPTMKMVTGAQIILGLLSFQLYCYRIGFRDGCFFDRKLL